MGVGALGRRCRGLLGGGSCALCCNSLRQRTNFGNCIWAIILGIGRRSRHFGMGMCWLQCLRTPEMGLLDGIGRRTERVLRRCCRRGRASCRSGRVGFLRPSWDVVRRGGAVATTARVVGWWFGYIFLLRGSAEMRGHVRGGIL